MRKLMEVHLFLNKSKTHPITPEERIKHVMRKMVKSGYVLGYWTDTQMSSVSRGEFVPPDFKVVNIDWRNEKATIEPLTRYPGWDVDTILLSIATQATWDKDHGFRAHGIYGMYFFQGDVDDKASIEHAVEKTNQNFNH